MSKENYGITTTFQKFYYEIHGLTLKLLRIFFINMNMDFSILKKYWYIFILIIVVFALFFPIQTTYDEPFKIYHSMIDLGFADYGVFSALIVGLLSFGATIYTNDKNLKATKLTILPEEYLTFNMKLESLLKFHNIKKNFKNYDIIETFIKIIKLGRTYQIIFKLAYPKIYQDLMDFIFGDLHNVIHSKNYEKNAEVIIADIKICILYETNDENKYKLIDSEKCTDETNIDDLGLIDIELSEKSLKQYINNIKGPKTRKLALVKYDEFIKFIETLIERLENEKEDIDDFL